MQRAACAHTDRCSGVWEVHWETVDLAHVLREGEVHLASMSRLHSAEMQVPGGSQTEVFYSMLFLLAPQAARADQGISLNARLSILSLSPTLQETATQIPTWL